MRARPSPPWHTETLALRRGAQRRPRARHRVRSSRTPRRSGHGAPRSSESSSGRAPPQDTAGSISAVTEVVRVPEGIEADSVLRPADHVGVVEIDDRLLLVHELAGRAWPLNPTASLVWRCLDDESELSEIAQDLSEVFEVPPESVLDEVTALVRTFGALGLLDGISGGVASIGVDFEFVAVDELGDVVPNEVPEPSFDDRYLAAPPNA
jgi:hypothetical protein